MVISEGEVTRGGACWNRWCEVCPRCIQRDTQNVVQSVTIIQKENISSNKRRKLRKDAKLAISMGCYVDREVFTPQSPQLWLSTDLVLVYKIHLPGCVVFFECSEKTCKQMHISWWIPSRHCPLNVLFHGTNRMLHGSQHAMRPCVPYATLHFAKIAAAFRKSVSCYIQGYVSFLDCIETRVRYAAPNLVESSFPKHSKALTSKCYVQFCHMECICCTPASHAWVWLSKKGVCYDKWFHFNLLVAES